MAPPVRLIYPIPRPAGRWHRAGRALPRETEHPPLNPKTKRAIRTALQTLAAVVAVLPALAAVVADSDKLAVAAPWLVGAAVSAAAVAAVVARAMASPLAEALLDRFGLGLVDDGPGDAAQ
ncbi:hypothetical protein QA943_18895 [Streptomyces sp. B21-097]|uniref:hypothetical protein n=1 Tax=Streptomyces sp. B21-097 TaxID=3039414 RepID=UPI002FEFF34C